jgi:hypothetical protein
MPEELPSLDTPSLTVWFVSYAIAGVCITIVVILVAIILTMARRIAVQAKGATDSLEESRVNTLPMWDVANVNEGLTGIVGSAQAARGVLEARL